MKTAVITGAGRGIGLALTKEFLKGGYQVIATYRNENSASELLKLAHSDKKLITVTADVTDEKTFGPLQEQLKKIGQIDILINNSGLGTQHSGGLDKLTMDHVMKVFQVNTLGPMRVTKLVAPFMKTGTIAHISSYMGSITDNGGGYYDYRMSKAALNMFNSSLAKEYSGLTCLVLHPGWVQTDMGGSSAPVTPAESAHGLYSVITKATHQQSGRFFDFKGKELPW